MKPPVAITNFIFQVGKCQMSSKAPDKATALMYLKRMWRDAKIEFIREESSHVMAPATPGLRPSTKSKPTTHVKRVGGVIAKNTDNISVEDRLTKTLVDSFGGI